MLLKLKEKEKQKTAEVAVEKKAQNIEEQKLVTFKLCVFGLPQIDTVQVKPGTKLKDFLVARNLDGIEVRLNKSSAGVREDYVIRENDLVVIIPDSIEGGRGDTNKMS